MPKGDRCLQFSAQPSISVCHPAKTDQCSGTLSPFPKRCARARDDCHACRIMQWLKVASSVRYCSRQAKETNIETRRRFSFFEFQERKRERARVHLGQCDAATERNTRFSIRRRRVWCVYDTTSSGLVTIFTLPYPTPSPSTPLLYLAPLCRPSLHLRTNNLFVGTQFVHCRQTVLLV